MEEIWDAILDLTAQFVIPDWSALIALLPIGLAALVALFFLSRIARFATAGPTRRGGGRVKPVAPPGIHMPGGSFAPIFGAVGTALLLFGLVAGGPALFLGVVALVLTLLYWGAEGMRDYDHLEHREVAPERPYREPPPGVHVPGPTFRPLLASLGVALLLLGLVFGGWVLLVGVLALVITLLGWLRDARKEYVEVEKADRTGHLENLPAPSWPVATIAVFALLLAGAAVLQLGILPPRDASGGGATGSPAPSAAPAADVAVVARNSAFDPTQLQSPADTAFTIAFTNEDAGINHNVFITDAQGNPVEMGDTAPFPGPKTVVYEVAPLAAGTYKFICVVHPTMTGELIAGG